MGYLIFIWTIKKHQHVLVSSVHAGLSMGGANKA